MRTWEKLHSTNTYREMIDFWNKNIDSAEFIDDMVGTILCNGVLFNGNETVDGMLIRPLTKVDLTGVVQSNTIFDNFTFYFRDTNNVIETNRFPVDLLSYADGKPHFIYIREDLSYRVSDYMFGGADEILLARFVINTDSTWNQFYIMAQRVGTPMYNAADEFYTVDGMYVKSPEDLELSQTSGTVKRSGIDFTDKVSPDIYQFYNLASERVPLRYINTANEIDYTQTPTYDVITDKYMIYNMDKKKKIQAEQEIQAIQNMYYMIEEKSNSVADELHEAIVVGGSFADLSQIVNAYVDYINSIYAEVTKLYNLLGDPVLSSVRRAGLLANKNSIDAYITANLTSVTEITEAQVTAIRNVPCYVVNINPAICPNPLEVVLQEVQDDLDEIDFNDGTIQNVPTGKFTIQRIMWDVYEQTLIMQYGDTVYDTFEDAVAGSGYMAYPPPFGKVIYIPLAIIVIKSGITSINNDTDTVIIDRRWIEVDQEINGYTDYVSRAYAKKALIMIEEIINGTTPVNKADTLKYTENGVAYYESGDYYLNYDNLRDRVMVIDDLLHNGYDDKEALSANQGYILDTKKLNLAGGTMTGTINSQNIIPKANTSYDLGSSSNMWNNVYANNIIIPAGGNIEFGSGGKFVHSSDGSVRNALANVDISSGTVENYTVSFNW